MAHDHACPCGCGLTAASSSRSASPLSPSVQKRHRTQHHKVRADSLEHQPLPSRAGRCCALQIGDVPMRPLGADISDRAELQSIVGRRRKPEPVRYQISVLPTLAITLLVFISTALASALPAATSASGLANTSSVSNITQSAIPTAAPSSAAATRGHQQLAAAAAAVAGTTSSAGPPNHNINVQISQPVSCQNMNITFDPSRGTPPYTVMISIEDYWPVIVSLTDTYDDASKDMWLYQYAVPAFTDNTTNPAIIVSVTDSTGLMSNSSSILNVETANFGTICAPFQYTSSFFFYTERAASMCQDYDIFWNGSYAPPMTALFLPEAAPPIYVPAPVTATNNMTWQVAMEGGTRFLMSLADSRAAFGNGGVSKLNIVALNEYFSNACIAESNYQHRVFAPTTTAPPASIFPDATSTIASLTTSRGLVATVTVVETIKNGRYVHGNDGGGLSSVGFLILMIVVFVSMGLIGVAVGWFCFRRHQKRKHNIKAWDLPSNDPSVPFSADPNMPIAPGVFGRSDTRQHSASASARAAADRTSVSGTSNYDPVSLTTRPLTHAPSTRNSLRSWTSSAFDHLQMATGAQGGNQGSATTAGDYALMNTAAGAGGHHARTLTVRTLSTGSREAWSPTDSVPRTFGFYSDDPQTPDSAGHPELRWQHRNASRVSSDGASSKSTRVGPGPTYRPDAASQAAYQDLLASNASPTNGADRTFPFSATRGQVSDSTTSPTSRTPGWAEISDGTINSTRIVRHADAGLLLDDNDNGDELINFGAGRLMELPPQYDTIHPSTASQHRTPHVPAPSNVGSHASQPRSQGYHHTHGLASVDIADAGNRPAEVHAADLVDENDDESAFWAH